MNIWVVSSLNYYACCCHEYFDMSSYPIDTYLAMKLLDHRCIHVFTFSKYWQRSTAKDHCQK